MIPSLQIQLLGEFRLLCAGDPVLMLDTPLRQRLLAYLLLHRHTPQLRRQIAFAFWPDSTERQAFTNLRKLLHQLRQGLAVIDDFLVVEYSTIGWRADIPLELDVAVLEAALDALEQGAPRVAERALEVVRLYRGELLPTCYDEWLLPLRRALHERVVVALEQAVARLSGQRDVQTALRCAEHLVRLDPLHETSYRQLMELHALAHDRAGALRIYHECARILDQELGVPPSSETQALHQRLLKSDAPKQETVRVPQALQLALVGRKAEWQVLQQVWRQVTQSGAHHVLIWGEAGIGKTRLVEELLHWARLRPGSVAYTRAYAAEGALAYAPVADWLRSEAIYAGLAKLDAVWRTELARLVPTLLTDDPHLPPPLPLSEDWQRQRFHEAMARAVLAAHRPLLLAIDDMQWCDRETTAWLRYLLRVDPHAPLLVLGTVRSEAVDGDDPLHEFVRQLQRAGQYSRMQLMPLDAAETVVLAEQVADTELGNPQKEAWRGRIYQETEGNPLFVVETMRAGLPEDTAQGADRAGGEMPATVQAVIATRLAQLSSSARQVAQLAATVGRVFRLEVLLAATALDEDDLVRGLDELWQRRLVRETQDGYDFSHDKIREVAYGEIGLARRRLTHRAVAAALERLQPDRETTHAAVIAVHYVQAGDRDKAVHYFTAAGRYAMTQYVNDEAIEYFTRALHLLGAEQDAREQDAREFGVRLLRHDLYYNLGKTVEQEVDLRALDQLAKRLDEAQASTIHRAEVGVRCARYLDRTGKISDSLEQAKAAVALAQAAGATTVEAHAYFCWGKAHWTQGTMREARPRYARAAELAHRVGQDVLEAESLEMLAATGMFSGMGPSTILEYLGRCYALYTRAGDVNGQASLFNKFGYLPMAQGTGEFDEAVGHYEKSIALYGQTGSRPSGGIAVSNLGLLYAQMGDYTAALMNLHSALTIARETESKLREGAALAYLGYTRRNMGDYAQARRHLERGLEISQVLRNRQWGTRTYCELALTLLGQGELSLAVDNAQHAIRIAQELADPRQEAAARMAMGHIHAAKGAWAKAAEAYAHASTQHAAMEQPVYLLMAQAGLADVAWRTGDRKAAQAQMEVILAGLGGHRIEYTDEALRIYITCHAILEVGDDPRAQAMLKAIDAQLTARAATLQDDEQRRLFWAAALHWGVSRARGRRVA